MSNSGQHNSLSGLAAVKPTGRDVFEIIIYQLTVTPSNQGGCLVRVHKLRHVKPGASHRKAKGPATAREKEPPPARPGLGPQGQPVTGLDGNRCVWGEGRSSTASASLELNVGNVRRTGQFMREQKLGEETGRQHCPGRMSAAAGAASWGRENTECEEVAPGKRADGGAPERRRGGLAAETPELHSQACAPVDTDTAPRI